MYKQKTNIYIFLFFFANPVNRRIFSRLSPVTLFPRRKIVKKNFFPHFVFFLKLLITTAVRAFLTCVRMMRIFVCFFLVLSTEQSLLPESRTSSLSDPSPAKKRTKVSSFKHEKVLLVSN